jgi:TolA-binding protein
MRELECRLGRSNLVAGILIALASLSCADPPYRTEVTSAGQGSVNLKRVPVEKRAKPADRITELERRVTELRGRVSELEAENARLRSATQPAGTQ